MNAKQQALMWKVMGNAANEFLSVGYPRVLSIVAGHQAAMLMAWGLEDSKKSLLQSATLMTRFQERFVCITPLEKGNLN